MAHIKISAPAVIDIDRLLQGKMKKVGKEYMKSALTWAEKDVNIDMIDLHAHVASVNAFKRVISYVKEGTSKPIIVTEWSQSKAGLNWLRSPLDGSFANQWDRGGRTGLQYMEQCYRQPVSLKEWNAFMRTSPFDPDFMKECYAIANAKRVSILCYGAQRQYGNAKFDTKQLEVNKTVKKSPAGKAHENYGFGKWYRELSSAVGRKK
jgi:hypothetical protein